MERYFAKLRVFRAKDNNYTSLRVMFMCSHPCFVEATHEVNMFVQGMKLDTQFNRITIESVHHHDDEKNFIWVYDTKRIREYIMHDSIWSEVQ